MKNMNIEEIKNIIYKRDHANMEARRDSIQRISKIVTSEHSHINPFSELIQKFNKVNSSIDTLCFELSEYYIKEGNRAKRIGSEDAAGISFMEDTCTFVSSHERDPMERKSYTLFDALCKLKFNNDFKQTLFYLQLNKDRFLLNNEDFPYSHKNHKKVSEILRNFSLNKLAPTKQESIVEAKEQDDNSLIIGDTIIYNGWTSTVSNQEYLCGDWFPCGSETIVCGPSSKGKSYWAAYFVGCLIKNRIFCERTTVFPIGGTFVRPPKIIIVLTEGSKIQYQVVLDKFNLTDEEKKIIFFVDWTGEQTREDFKTTLNYINYNLKSEVKLLLVDSLTQVISFQKNDDISSALDKLHLFNETTKLFPQCAKVYISHPGKPAKENRGRESKEQFLNTFDKYNIIGSSNYVNLPRQILMTNSFMYDKKLYFFVKKDKDNTAFNKSIEIQEEESRIQQFVFEDDMYKLEDTNIIDEYFSKEDFSHKPSIREVIDNTLKIFNTKTMQEKRKIIEEFKSSYANSNEANPINLALYLCETFEIEGSDRMNKDNIRSALNRTSNTLKIQLISILNNNTHLL